MKLRLVVSLVLLVLFAVAASLAWTLLGWPPPRLVLKYGIPPYCEPTGRVAKIEGLDFVEIGPGCFRMGSTYLAKEGDLLGNLCSMFGLPWGDQPKPSNEMPVHWVEFPRGFWISRYEVTNEQYERFRPGHERPLSLSKHTDRHPVRKVSLGDARRYCIWLSERSRLDIRLPSEAMWEASCRAGKSVEFCFGDDAGLLAHYATFRSNSRWGPTEVGTHRANAWGLFDLHGNVGELCEDPYFPNHNGAPVDGSSRTRSDPARIDWRSQLSVSRGGSFNTNAEWCRSAARTFVHRDWEVWDLGFRPSFSLSADQGRAVVRFLVATRGAIHSELR